MATLWAYQALVSTIPALGLYVMGLLLSPNLNVAYATWDIPLRILAGSVVLMLPTSVFALCLSSLTQESRYAGFAWFAVWILGFFTYLAVTSPEATRQAEQFRDTGRVEWTESEWTHLSPYHTLARVQTWIFGFSDFRDVMISVLILVLVTAISLVILVRRISAPMRV